jgi:hypothetical protein
VKLMFGDFGTNIVGFRTRGNATLGWLGDDSSTLTDLGFSATQIAQIETAHASGALSDSGYNQIVSGNVPPQNVADFMAADPGATVSSAPTAAVSTLPGTMLTPGPSPRVAVPVTSFGAWFSQSTLIAGLPNWILLAAVAVPLLWGSTGRRR